MNLKRTVAAVLAIIMLLALAACGEEKEEEQDESSSYSEFTSSEAVQIEVNMYLMDWVDMICSTESQVGTILQIFLSPISAALPIQAIMLMILMTENTT